MQTRLLVLCIILLSASCKKSNELGTPERVTANVTTATGSFTIDATNSNVSVGRFIIPVIDIPYVAISGWRNNYEAISLTLPDEIHIGTYNTTLGSAWHAQFENTSTGDVFAASDGSGTITVTSYSGNYITGTFQFTGYKTNGDSVVVTNGTFEGDL